VGGVLPGGAVPCPGGTFNAEGDGVVFFLCTGFWNCLEPEGKATGEPIWGVLMEILGPIPAEAYGGCVGRQGDPGEGRFFVLEGQVDITMDELC
jgi:hypothetical protein